MRKILIVSSKGISSHNFDGAGKRIFEIAKFLSKKNRVDFVCLENKKPIIKDNFKFFNSIKEFRLNFIFRILNALLSILQFQPMQKGFFFSKNMFDFINDNKDDYDVIIFHLIRSAQYLPNNFHGKTILEMTDLGSENYSQIIKNMSVFNPLTYLYILEKTLLRSYERKLSNSFDKVVFISKNELFITKNFIDKDRIEVIGTSAIPNKKIYRYKRVNNKILFIGNINYLPNKLACYNFSKNIMPKLNEVNPELKFNIIGRINFFDKFFLKLFKNIEIHGPVLKPDKIIKKSVCGICNLNVATGIQNKIFTYLSYGLPTIVTKKCLPDNLSKNKEILVYNNNNELIHLIKDLYKNKKTAEKISKNGFKALKIKYNMLKTYGRYLKII